MKNIKKILALLMVCVMVIGLSACHKKNETAVKVGSMKFTSGYYACALFFKYSEARSKVDEQLTEDGKDTTDVDYIKQKIDGKKFADYVKEETLNDLKRVAACKLYCKENKLKLGDTEAQMKSYAEYYWENGYSSVLTENGVGKDTYVSYTLDHAYEDLYFNHIFGADGEKAISEDDLKAELSKNYALADMLEVSFTDLEETEQTQKTEQLNGYLEELSKGKRTFEEIYHEYNGETEEETEEATDDSQTDKPLDSHATLIGNSDTTVANDNFDEIYAMKNGEVKIIDMADNAGKILVVKKDVLEDPYYLKNYDSALRHAVADDDFDKIVEKYAKTLKLKEYKSSTDAFKVKKIYYPVSSSES